MGKRVTIAILAFLTFLVLAFGVWGQKEYPLKTFSGVITKVDLAKKEIVVQNNKDEKMSFQLNDETKVMGSSQENAALDSKNLKEEMPVTVSYREGGLHKVAAWVDVMKGNLKTLRGMQFPFDGGPRVC